VLERYAQGCCLSTARDDDVDDDDDPDDDLHPTAATITQR
jgi:hypothetical protein